MGCLGASPPVQEVVGQPGLGGLGIVGRCPILLEDVGAAPGHLIHPGLHNIPHHINVRFGIHREAPLKEVGGHDVPLVGDHPEHHHRRQELGGHHHRDIAGVNTQPPVILSVEFLILVEIFFIRKKNQLGVLKKAIMDRFAGMPPAEIMRACSGFRSRIKPVMEAEGDFIE